MFCHLLCVGHLSRGGQYVVDDQSVPRCAHKMEVVRPREELGLKVSSATGKGVTGVQPTQEQVKGTSFKLYRS